MQYFTEQGSSASQTTAAKVMDVIARLHDCDGQAADAISAYTQVKIKDAHKLLKILKCHEEANTRWTDQVTTLKMYFFFDRNFKNSTSGRWKSVHGSKNQNSATKYLKNSTVQRWRSVPGSETRTLHQNTTMEERRNVYCPCHTRQVRWKTDNIPSETRSRRLKREGTRKDTRNTYALWILRIITLSENCKGEMESRSTSSGKLFQEPQLWNFSTKFKRIWKENTSHLKITVIG